VKRSRAGFSFVEVLVVMIFIGLLARLAVPRYSDMKLRAKAAAVAGDVHAIRLAAFTHYTDKQTWPPDYGPGVVPSELADYLPGGFSFTRADFTYDFEQWTLSSGTPGDPQQEQMIGVAVIFNDARLADAVMRIAGRGYGPFRSGNRVTFLITGLGGG
jgi:type II secretory pathway pseudopilin PulG